MPPAAAAALPPDAARDIPQSAQDIASLTWGGVFLQAGTVKCQLSTDLGQQLQMDIHTEQSHATFV